MAGDVAIAVVLLALGLVETWAALPSRDGPGNPGWTSVSVLVATLPLVFRRSRPLAVVVVAGLGVGLLYALAPVYVLFYGQFVPAAVVTFSAARYGRGRVPFYGAVASVLIVGELAAVSPQERGPDSLAFNVVGLGLAWTAGWALTMFERRAAASRQQAIDAEVAAARLAMAAVLDERTRIARELHDVVAHAVSVIVVQAGAAEPAVQDDPEFARQALETIRATGVSALGEMRRVVTMLRDGDDPQLLTPQPGADAVPDLIEHAREVGLDAELQIVGGVVALPAGLDLAVYRIVQEALSNVRRHASASHAWVCLSYRPDCLQVEIRDDGTGAAATTPVGGHGLIGMRERAALYGGQLETTSVPGRGFTVRATLPLAG